MAEPKSTINQINTENADTSAIDAERARLNGEHEAFIAELTAEHDQKVAGLTQAHEAELAKLRAELTAAQTENADLRESMKSGKPTPKRKDGLVEVRVTNPLIVPSPDGAPDHTLTAGLNYVPQWVADHWLVKASTVKEEAPDDKE